MPSSTRSGEAPPVSFLGNTLHALYSGMALAAALNAHPDAADKDEALPKEFRRRWEGGHFK